MIGPGGFMQAPKAPEARKRVRAAPKAPGRCCWLCGRPGGVGATIALELLGFEVGLLPGTPPQGDLPAQKAIGYAHPECLRREQKKAARDAGLDRPFGTP